MSLLMQSCYVKATDGIKLAIDVMLPKDKPSNAPLPCVLFQARYAKAHCQDRLAMCMQGYAILYVALLHTPIGCTRKLGS